MRLFLNLAATVICALILGSCGGGSVSSNPYFGNLPAMMADFVQKREKLDTKANESKSFDEARKLSDEMEALQKATDSEIDNYLTDESWKKPIPFTGLPDKGYQVDEVGVHAASSYNLNLKFRIRTEGPIPNARLLRDIFVYFKAVDSKGADIPGSKTVAGNISRDRIPESGTFEVYGGWKSKEVLTMNDFAGIVEITREEYDRK